LSVLVLSLPYPLSFTLLKHRYLSATSTGLLFLFSRLSGAMTGY